MNRKELIQYAKDILIDNIKDFLAGAECERENPDWQELNDETKKSLPVYLNEYVFLTEKGSVMHFKTKSAMHYHDHVNGILENKYNLCKFLKINLPK